MYIVSGDIMSVVKDQDQREMAIVKAIDQLKLTVVKGFDQDKKKLTTIVDDS